MKFTGTLEDLKAIMLNITSRGTWSGKRNQFQCRLPSGAILNWWASTGTIVIQGPDEAAAKLESIIGDYLLKHMDKVRDDQHALRGDYIEVEYSEMKSTHHRGAATQHQHEPVVAPKLIPRLPKRP